MAAIHACSHYFTPWYRIKMLLDQYSLRDRCNFPWSQFGGQSRNRRRHEKRVCTCFPWDLVKFKQFANTSFHEKKSTLREAAYGGE